MCPPATAPRGRKPATYLHYIFDNERTSGITAGWRRCKQLGGVALGWLRDNREQLRLKSSFGFVI
eukprot:2513126-Pyramimonas_sp.AAC.1